MDTDKHRFGSKCGEFAIITSGRNPVEFDGVGEKGEGHS